LAAKTLAKELNYQCENFIKTRQTNINNEPSGCRYNQGFQDVLTFQQKTRYILLGNTLHFFKVMLCCSKNLLKKQTHSESFC
jgi:hypothetical protein